jgi:murein DD-endopeptidase MepM/ murein hydrolase activator NlpD
MGCAVGNIDQPTDNGAEAMVRTDSQFYGDPITADGYRIDNENGNAVDKSKNWSQAVADAKKKAGSALPQDAQFVVVEKGDCLWRIAEQYGVDPQQLVNDNRPLFENPNLIHPNQVVIVRKTPANAKAFEAPGSSQPGGGQQPGQTTGPQMMGPPSVIGKIKADGERVNATCAAADYEALRKSIEAYIGPLGSEDWIKKVRELYGYNWGSADSTITREITHTVAGQINRLGPDLPAATPNQLAERVQKHLVAFLCALPEDQKADAIKLLMDYKWDNPNYGYADSKFMRAQIQKVVNPPTS